MKVKQLIAELKKLNQDSLVIFQDHDQNDDESSGGVTSVAEVESEIIFEKYGSRKIVALR